MMTSSVFTSTTLAVVSLPVVRGIPQPVIRLKLRLEINSFWHAQCIYLMCCTCFIVASSIKCLLCSKYVINMFLYCSLSTHMHYVTVIESILHVKTKIKILNITVIDLWSTIEYNRMCTIGFISNWHILYRTSSLVFLCLYTCTKRAPDRWKYTYTGYTVYPLFLSLFFYSSPVNALL